MRVQFAHDAADADTTGAGAAFEAKGNINELGFLHVHLTLDPSGVNQDIDVRVEGRPGTSSGWHRILQLNDATGGWYNSTGTVHINIQQSIILLPLMRVRIVAVASSTNVITAWLGM